MLEADATLLGHLDSCLLCRSCEKSCPSGVRFGELMDQARAMTLEQRPRWLRQAAGLLSNRRRARWGLALSSLLPDRWLPGGAGLASAARHLARRKYRPGLQTQASDGPYVGLFRGCVADTVQASVLAAAQDLLHAAGARVAVPHSQGCCGAMHGHLGDADRAASQARRNHEAFAIAGLDAIVSLASGCGAQLAEQDPPLTAPHRDVSDYLAESGLIDRLSFHPAETQALVHIPCTQANVLGGGKAVFELLARIPGLQVTKLTAGSNCCGAAGLQLLSHPAQGEALRAPKADAIRASDATLLITSNPGCALHLAAGLGRSDVEVMHPVELLARQLDQSR
jgi:glycolate oxidase iron-sulfur subunit